MAPLFDLCGRGACGVCNRFSGAKGRGAVSCGFELPDHQRGLRASGGGVPQGMRVETMILYSYSHCNEPLETRWVEDGIPDFFYTNEEAARQAILSLREEVGEAEWTPMRIERIEIEPMTDENVLILLNDGIAAILTAYEIVETVS